MAPQIAWIGLGNMGRGMCKNLIEKGNLEKPLIVFNRTAQRAIDLNSKFPSKKSSVASSISDAVSKSDIIFTCLGDDAAVRDTITSALKENVKEKLFVDCSTVHPDTTDELANMIQAQGAEFVACPVFGAPPMAESGQLVCVLAGESAAVERVKPYTEGVMGRANIDFSGQAQRKATLLKVIGNTFILNAIEALSEGHTLAEKTGLGSANLHQFVELMLPGPYVQYSQRMTVGDYYKREEPLFNTALARKDASHALNLAESSGTKLKDVEVAYAHLADVQKYMGSKGDLPGIYGAVRQESGLKFELE